MASIRKRRGKAGTKWQVRGPGIESRTFTALADAKVYASEEERRIRLGEHWVAPTETFGLFLDSWLERKRKTSWRESTYRKNKYASGNLRGLRLLPLHEVNRGKAEDLLADIVGRDAPREAQVVLALLKGVLRSAEARKHRIDTSIFRMSAPKYESRKARFLTLDQLRELASYCPDYIHRLILVAGLTGLRQGELLALRDTSLNLDDGYLVVERGKTHTQPRKVYLLAEAKSLLREQLVVRAAGTSLVFPTEGGYQWNPNNLMERVFRPAREAAGLDCTFHDLRHSFVSIAARSGMKKEVVAEITGWSAATVDAMFNRYRHVHQDEVVEALAVLDKAVNEG